MKNLLYILFLALGITVNAQVAINTDASLPDNSAMLDIKSTIQGVLLPRMTQAQRNAITSPAAGLTVFQTDNIPGIYFNSGTSGSPLWVVAGNGTSWSLSGNSGTIAGTSFLGTTDNVPFTFRVNNQPAGKIDHLQFNTSLGFRSLALNTLGSFNTAIGHQALSSSSSADNNTAIGFDALYSNTVGTANTAMGVSAMYQNTEGSFNIGIGNLVLYYNTLGNNNSAFGLSAMRFNTIGSNNTAFGMSSLYSNTTDGQNTAIGAGALQQQSFNNSNTAYNSNNVAVGYQALFSNQPTGPFNGFVNTGVGTFALYNNTTGSYNTAVGEAALWSNTGGYYNTAIGTSAGYFNTTGGFNVGIGNFALYDNSLGSQNTAVGVQAMITNTIGSDNTAVGENALSANITADENVAIGKKALQAQSYSNGNTEWVSGNVAVGYQALYSNQPTSIGNGIVNTAVGNFALYGNTTGYSNSANGYQALYNNTTGSYNTASGYQALYNNSGGQFNTATGMNALFSNGNGNNNTGVGYNAYPTDNPLTNWTGLGYNVGSGTSITNSVEIGNTSVTSIKGEVAFTTYSDGRIKDNIVANVPGMDFIKKLRPVTYNLNIHRQNEMMYGGKKEDADWPGKYDIEKIRMTGFIAQEVEQASEENGYDFSGVVKPQTADGLYGLRYSDFVVPLVKAVQEQQDNIEKLESANADLTKKVEALLNRIEMLESRK